MARAKRREAALQKRAASEIHRDSGSNGFDRAVKEAVDGLPAMYREVVVLHYYSGLSYQEIESVLGVSSDKVKGRLARARRQIQVHLEKEGFRREQ
jgi:RNA polymerase sigma-70 factor (ECF subfamily)